jgi:hypothetical protein
MGQIPAISHTLDGTENTGQVITVRVVGTGRIRGAPAELVFFRTKRYSPQSVLMATTNAAIGANAASSSTHKFRSLAMLGLGRPVANPGSR